MSRDGTPSIPRWKQRGVGLLRRSTIGNGYLLARTYGRQTGWLASMRGGSPVNRHGDPEPWMTIPAIRFLVDRIPADARILEWGAGSSTAWWATRAPAGTVTAIEHDDAWVTKVAAGLPANATVRHIPLGPDYIAPGVDGPWDLAVIDGRDRVACARHAVDVLSDRGAIVWDDAGRERYRSGLTELTDSGWSRVDFHGPKPLSWSEHSTAVLFRPGKNLFGL